jgi:hypothetical protein
VSGVVLFFDLLADPAFTPCREERCQTLGLHPAHVVPVGRGRQPRRCPVCNGAIVREPRKYARCTRCAWNLTVPTRTR